MFSNEFFDFDINDVIGSNTNTYFDDNFNLDGFGWNVAGPSQPYTGADVYGDLNGYPDFFAPSTAPPTIPTSSYPNHGAFLNEGYDSFHQGSAMSSLPQQGAMIHPPFPTYSPVQALPYGTSSLRAGRSTAPTNRGQHPYARPEVVPSSDSLGVDFGLTGGTSLPMVNPPPPHNQTYEQCLGHYSQFDPPHLDAHSTQQTTGAIDAPEIDPPAPASPSTGPQRRRRTRKPPRRSTAQEKATKKEGWNQTLVRFQAQFEAFLNDPASQPAGGLTPEMALVQVFKTMKDDLKNTPLRDTKTGNGTRGPRSIEEYLKGLLRVIRPADQVPVFLDEVQVCVMENQSAVAVFSRLADELEGRLAAVNQSSKLLKPVYLSQPRPEVDGEQDEQRAYKNGSEKERRSRERDSMERISRFFKARPRQQWSRQDLLGLSTLFLLYGPGIFPPGFVEVLPTASGS